MLQAASMIHFTARRTHGALGPAALLAAVLAAPALPAQDRGEEILGTIAQVDNMTLLVKREGSFDVRATVTAQTEVTFRDSGDRKLFPNPTVRDLRAGMGVRFVYGTGTLDRIVVHYVPPSGPAPGAAAAIPGSEQVKARIVSVTRGGREIRADVGGTTRTYRVADAAGASGLRRGNLVVLTLEDRTGERVVTRVDPAEMVGTVTRVDSGRRSITIGVNGREETYDVDRRDLLDDVRAGQRVRFEVEERGNGRRVITALRRD